MQQLSVSARGLTFCPRVSVPPLFTLSLPLLPHLGMDSFLFVFVNFYWGMPDFPAKWHQWFLCSDCLAFLLFSVDSFREACQSQEKKLQDHRTDFCVILCFVYRTIILCDVTLRRKISHFVQFTRIVWPLSLKIRVHQFIL